MMDLNYDEDVTENIFFRILRDEHKEIFEKATAEGCVICIPRAGSVSKYSTTLNDILCHILVPSDELPESHFRTLNEKDVKICNRVVSIEHDDISRPHSTHILFEETFYTDDLLKYKVLCIERPLELMCGESVRVGIVTVQSLWDCIDLLWTETAGRQVLEKIDELLLNFLSANKGLELTPMQRQLDKTCSLYTECLQVVLKDQRVREKCRTNSCMLDNVKLSVESYMHHSLYKVLIKGITACTAREDAALNKIIRNISDLQLQDLGARSELHDTVPKAKQELARIDCYSTALGKIGCLRRTFLAVSRSTYGCDPSEGNALAADDVLSVLVFLIIKAGLANWVAHLTFLRKFRFSANPSLQTDEASFLITSLEAAIEHIKSGGLLGHTKPETLQTYEIDRVETDGFLIINHKSNDEFSSPTPNKYTLVHLFDEAKLGNVDKVCEILDYCTIQEQQNESSSKLCHPLCSCDKCERELSRFQCETYPTIFTCDDRGFTVLHVACFYGQPKVVDLLLSRGVHISAQDYSGSTPLHYSSARGHQNALLLLLHAGADVQCRDNDGNTPLHLCVGNGHDACVKALLYFAEHVGIELDINVTNNNGDTPLHHAARWGYESIVRTLLEYGADPEIENKRHLNAILCSHSVHVSHLLMTAVGTKNRSVIFGSVKNTEGKSDIPIAALSKENLDFSDDSESVNGGSYEYSHLRPKNVEQIRKVEKVINAVFNCDVPLACYYLGIQGPTASVDQSTGSFCHPLCNCEGCLSKSNAASDCAPSQKALSVNVCNSRGLTPLHVAAMKGIADFIQILLDAGAYPNVQTRPDGLTPLHMACKEEQAASVKVLARCAECKLDLQDSYGNTALHFACLAGGIKMTEILLKEGASPDLRNAAGQRPLDLAEEKMSLTLVKLLKGGKLLA